MPERLILAMTIIGGLVLLYGAWKYYKARLIQTIQSTSPATGKPTLLYFTGEYCTACRLQQTPIVEKISARLGETIAIKTYDVSTNPHMAGRYKVLTLPTTVVLDEQGEVKAINYGVAAQSKLEAQLG